VKYKRTWIKVGGGTVSGTINRVPKFTGATTLGNSSIVDSASSVAITINPSGSVGIGSTFATNTAGFSKQLQVEGTYPALTLKNITGTPSAYSFGANASGDVGIWNNNTSLYNLYITSAGNVGIGYTAPAAKLAVSGTTLINTNTDNGVDELQVNGSISGIGMKQNYVAKTGAYTATNADYVIDCTSGSFTVTLYAASGNAGRILIVKNSGAGSITLDGNASETIDGNTTLSLLVQYDAVQIMCDGTNWKIISKL
jgi:hypothetical protein